MRAGIWQRFRVPRPIRSLFRLAAASRRAAGWQVRIACAELPELRALATDHATACIHPHAVVRRELSFAS